MQGLLFFKHNKASFYLNIIGKNFIFKIHKFNTLFSIQKRISCTIKTIKFYLANIPKRGNVTSTLHDIRSSVHKISVKEK